MACQIKVKFHCLFSYMLSNITISSIAIALVFLSNPVQSQECRQISNCRCKFLNGSIIDLTSISSAKGASFSNVSGGNYSYFFNPCFPFSLGERCTDVAVCQINKNRTEYQDCGNHDGGFVWNPITQALNLIYSEKGGDRKTNVTLICSPDAITSKLNFISESPKMIYNMNLISKCACSDLCSESHLSAGSVLVIIFMIFVSLYLVLGIIHSSLTRGAHGWELIPHYEFWADFPLLIRDGCVFVMNGCKADTAYERI